MINTVRGSRRGYGCEDRVGARGREAVLGDFGECRFDGCVRAGSQIAGVGVVKRLVGGENIEATRVGSIVQELGGGKGGGGETRGR